MRIVEREAAPVAQLQDGDRGEGLGDRGPVVDRGASGGVPALPIAPAIGVSRQHPPAAEDDHTPADDAVRSA